MVRLFVEQRARAIGLVEGVTSFTQLRLKSMQYGSLNFVVFFFLKRNHLVLFEFKFERQLFCHISSCSEFEHIRSIRF